MNFPSEGPLSGPHLPEQPETTELAELSKALDSITETSQDSMIRDAVGKCVHSFSTDFIKQIKPGEISKLTANLKAVAQKINHFFSAKTPQSKETLTEVMTQVTGLELKLKCHQTLNQIRESKLVSASQIQDLENKYNQLLVNSKKPDLSEFSERLSTLQKMLVDVAELKRNNEQMQKDPNPGMIFQDFRELERIIESITSTKDLSERTLKLSHIRFKGVIAQYHLVETLKNDKQFTKLIMDKTEKLASEGLEIGPRYFDFQKDLFELFNDLFSYTSFTPSDLETKLHEISSTFREKMVDKFNKAKLFCVTKKELLETLSNDKLKSECQKCQSLEELRRFQKNVAAKILAEPIMHELDQLSKRHEQDPYIKAIRDKMSLMGNDIREGSPADVDKLISELNQAKENIKHCFQQEEILFELLKNKFKNQLSPQLKELFVAQFTANHSNKSLSTHTEILENFIKHLQEEDPGIKPDRGIQLQKIIAATHDPILTHNKLSFHEIADPIIRDLDKLIPLRGRDPYIDQLRDDMISKESGIHNDSLIDFQEFKTKATQAKDLIKKCYEQETSLMQLMIAKIRPSINASEMKSFRKRLTANHHSEYLHIHMEILGHLIKDLKEKRSSLLAYSNLEDEIKGLKKMLQPDYFAEYEDSISNMAEKLKDGASILAKLKEVHEMPISFKKELALRELHKQCRDFK